MKLEIQNNTVLQDGKPIGAIHEGACYSAAPIAGPIKGNIRKLPGMEELKFYVNSVPSVAQEGVAGIPTTEQPAPSPLSTLSDDDLAAEMKRRGMIQDAPVEPPAVQPLTVPARDTSSLERLHQLADAGSIPQPPVRHPAMGDKDPAFVAWFKQHATAHEIAVRYPENRRVPATVAEFTAAEAKLKGKLPGEKKDTAKENDFTDKAE